MFFKKSSQKIFCIGANKTGTTSVEKALSDLGYKLGNQEKAQDLIEYYKTRNFKKIAAFCQKSDAFQDAPFSWHYTGIFMDQHFKDAKFILTQRDNAEEWYESLIRFHSKLLNTPAARKPTTEELKKARRGKNRTMWDNFSVRHELPEDDPYNKRILTQYYMDHNKMIEDYFRFKDNLLIINLKDKSSYKKFCSFIGKKPLYDEFPWKNKSKISSS